MATAWLYRMVLVVRVEGNIGCGKSTLLHHIGESVPGIEIVGEPVSGWCEHIRGVYDSSVADLWKLPMQMISACTRAEAFVAAMRPRMRDRFGCVMVERSHTSARIFGQLTLCSEEMAAFDLLGDRYVKIWDAYFKEAVQATIYLRASPETCLARIQTRSRKGEHGITLEFLKQLCDKHDASFLQSADLVVDCDDASSDAVAAQVTKFLKSAI